MQDLEFNGVISLQKLALEFDVVDRWLVTAADATNNKLTKSQQL